MRKTSMLVTGALTLAAATASVTAAFAGTGGGHPTTVRPAAAPSFAETVCQIGVNDGGVVAWNPAPVVAGQPVVASAVEVSGTGQEFFGDAAVWAEGVVVTSGTVQVRVHTGWTAPLNICVHIVG